MIVLTFNDGLPNQSLEIGDLVYYTANVNNNYEGSGFATSDLGAGLSTHILIGTCASIEIYNVDAPEDVNQTTAPFNFKVYVDETTSLFAPPSDNDFIFFVKNNVAEQSAIKGYYNSVTLENNSIDKAELFAVACDVVESSK